MFVRFGIDSVAVSTTYKFPSWRNCSSTDTVGGGAPSGPHCYAFSLQRALKMTYDRPDPEICWAVFSLWNLQKDEQVLFFRMYRKSAYRVQDRLPAN